MGWCAKCAKNLAFGTFNTSAAGALNIHGYVPTTYLEVELGVHFYFYFVKLYFLLRAPAADVLNVPNAKFLAHLAHQTQKRSFIRCSKW